MRPQNNNDLIHLFAQRSTSSAQYGNLFFENGGHDLYSYGRHYKLAQFITNKAGADAVIINDSGYSNSTAKHISIARAALSHYKTFYTTQTDGKKVLQELEFLLKKLIKAKKPELYLNAAEDLYNNYFEFRAWCPVGGSFTLDAREYDKKIKKVYTFFSSEDPAKYEAKKEAARKLAATKAKKAAAAKYADDLKKFFNFELNYIYKNSELSPEDFTRVNEAAELVETTQGVKVSARAAATLYKMIKAGKDIKGAQIDGYTVISLNGVLTIGCHKINRANMEQTGEQLLKLGY